MIVAMITVNCDHCHTEYDSADVTAKLIREAAKADGWGVALPGGSDLCPACMKRGKDPAIFAIRRGLLTAQRS